MITDFPSHSNILEFQGCLQSYFRYIIISQNQQIVSHCTLRKVMKICISFGISLLYMFTCLHNMCFSGIYVFYMFYMVYMFSFLGKKWQVAGPLLRNLPCFFVVLGCSTVLTFQYTFLRHKS